MLLSCANRLLGLHGEGMRQAEEAWGICKRLGHAVGQAESLYCIALSLNGDDQLDAAEEAALWAIELSSDQGDESLICQCHRLLGIILYSKGETEKAANHFETALGIASSFSWRNEQFWIHLNLARLFLDRANFDAVHTHIKQCKSHTVDDAYKLGCVMRLQAYVWWRQCRLEEAKSEVSRAAEVFEKLGAGQDLERCRIILQDIQEEMSDLVATCEPDSDGEVPQTVAVYYAY